MSTTTIEKQIRDLSALIVKFDKVIKDMDRIADSDQQQRTALVEQRKQLNAQKDVLMSHPAVPSKSVVSDLAQGIEPILPIWPWPHDFQQALIAALEADTEIAREWQTLQEKKERYMVHLGKRGRIRKKTKEPSAE